MGVQASERAGSREGEWGGGRSRTEGGRADRRADGRAGDGVPADERTGDVCSDGNVELLKLFIVKASAH